MTTPFFCVFLAFVLVYLSHAPGLYARWRSDKGYDNKQPRRQQRKLKGWAARAHAGHQNALETFPIFVSAVVINHLAGGDLRMATALCIAYLVVRVLYHVAYIADADFFRTLCWMIGFVLTAVLFLEPWLNSASNATPTAPAPAPITAPTGVAPTSVPTSVPTSAPAEPVEGAPAAPMPGAQDDAAAMPPAVQ